MTGIPNDAQPSITFYAIAVAPVATEQPTPFSTLAIMDPDHFTSLAEDGAWRAVFTREAEGDSLSGGRSQPARARAPVIQAPLVSAASDLSHPDSLKTPAAVH